MTDFLTNIVTRNLGAVGATATIRPRLASLFEPIRGEVACMEMEAETIVTRPSAGLDRATTEARQPEHRPPPAPANSREGAPATAVKGPLLPSTAPLAPLRDSGSLETAPVERIVEHRESVPVSSHRPDEDSRSSISEPQVTPPVARPRSELQPIRRELVVPSPGREDSLEPAHHALLVPPRMTGTLAADLRRSLPPGRTRPQKSSRAAAEQAPPASSAEPDIHVTIGRIEVRATVENTPARPSRPTSSAMSLEEYLRRRNQRGAR
jgi:hypothetical protein